MRKQKYGIAIAHYLRLPFVSQTLNKAGKFISKHNLKYRSFIKQSTITLRRMIVVRKQGYTVTVAYNVRIPFASNMFHKIINAIDRYNAKYRTLVQSTTIKLSFNSSIYSLNKENFQSSDKTLPFEKAVELLKSKKADLYMYRDSRVDRIDFLHVNNEVHLKNEEMQFHTEAVHLHFDKNVYEFDNNLSIIIAIMEEYKGSMILLAEQDQLFDNCLLLFYKDGEELTNIEDKNAVCYNLFTEYRLEVFFPNLQRELIFEANIEHTDKTLTSDSWLLNEILDFAKQSGYQINLAENDKFVNITFQLKNLGLFDIIGQKLNITLLDSYVSNNEYYKQKMSTYFNKTFKTYARFRSDYHYNDVYNQIIDLQSIMDFIAKRDYLVQVIQKGDSLFINLYNAKTAYLTASEETPTMIVKRKSDNKVIVKM